MVGFVGREGLEMVRDMEDETDVGQRDLRLHKVIVHVCLVSGVGFQYPW